LWADLEFFQSKLFKNPILIEVLLMKEMATYSDIGQKGRAVPEKLVSAKLPKMGQF
jgi:hypothetical protein